MLKNKVFKSIAKILASIFGKKGYIQIKLIKDRVSRLNENRFIRKYTEALPRILNEIKAKDIIEIVFYITNLSMWRYEELVKLLILDNRFKVIIIPYIYPNWSDTEAREVYSSITDYCHKSGFPVLEEYNLKDRKYSEKVYSLKPDIVVYTQPYGRGDQKLQFKNYADNSLFLYTPYGLGVDKNPIFYDTTLHNISVILYLQTQIEYEIQKKNARNKGGNAVVVGCITNDELKKELKNPWPQNENKYNIIWAPHHTIQDTDFLNNATFLQVCSYMLNIAKEHKDINFAFRPHPALKEKLYKIWGHAKTKQYFNSWDSLPNGFVSDGQFVPLFKYSDAMIHDCSSFLCEYILTGRPALYLVNEDHLSELSELGKECFNLHYQGISERDIKNFLERIVIKGVDPLRKKREGFIKRKLISQNGNNVGQNMYEVLRERLD